MPLRLRAKEPFRSVTRRWQLRCPGRLRSGRPSVRPSGSTACRGWAGTTATARIGKESKVTYRLEFPGGGSGGDEGYLIGVLKLGAATFAITCVTQAEGLRRGDAEWCLEELRRLRIVH